LLPVGRIGTCGKQAAPRSRDVRRSWRIAGPNKDAEQSVADACRYELTHHIHSEPHGERIHNASQVRATEHVGKRHAVSTGVTASAPAERSDALAVPT